MRFRRLASASAVAVASLVPAVAVSATPSPPTATLTLTADEANNSPPFDTIYNEGIVLTASGTGGTLSGPSGVSGELPPGTYELSMIPPDVFVAPDGTELHYSFGPAFCSNTPSGVLSVTLNADDDVTCVFLYVLGGEEEEAGGEEAGGSDMITAPSGQQATPTTRPATTQDLPETGGDWLLATALASSLLGAGVVVIGVSRRQVSRPR